MSPALDLLQAVFDPRGRCSRRGFLLVSVALIVVECGAVAAIVLTADRIPTQVIRAGEAICIWIALAASIKRLHDCGRTAWWCAAALVLVMAWCFILTLALVLILGPGAMHPQSQGFALALAGSFLPLALMAVWLHVARGESDANSYGPVPVGFGCSHPGSFGSTERGFDTPSAEGA